MKKTLALTLAVVFSAAICSATNPDRGYNEPYSGKYLDHIAFPIGGLGSGMFCFEGTGAISNMSMHHYPELFHEPCAFAAVCVKGLVNGAKVLETNVPDYKKFGRNEGGMGVGGTTWGLPRFDEGEFTASFPFANLKLTDADMPLEVNIKVWNPFIPNDEDNSGLPVAGFEYTFTNVSDQPQEAIFSFNTRNFMYRGNDARSSVEEFPLGFILNQEPSQRNPEWEGQCAVFTDEPMTVCDYCWFRGGWFDPLTMAWNKVASGELIPNGTGEGAPGGSLFVPFKVNPGESRIIHMYMAWYVPRSHHRIGGEARDDNERGARYDENLYKDIPNTYEPWYAHKFADVNAVAAYWLANYESLKAQTELFNKTFYDTTLPSEVVEAVAANMTILKSPTVMRQHDGRMWNWEGSGDNWGSCHGSCEHVWNYAQAIPHLFPRMERTLRETEFNVSQSKEGHQTFRTNLPIRPVEHGFHAASDGQLGGIVKVYREWRISGDNEWLKDIYPQVKASIDYCIRTWDPDRLGAVIEPHHNTYDIEFWGPGGMCTSFYAAALQSFIEMSKALKIKCKDYETLYAKCQDYMTTNLWNGEYFYQQVRWKDLKSPDPTKAQSFQSTYTPEAQAILEVEGPKYQYGTGCISDGVLGCFMSVFAGLPDPVDQEKVKSHLASVYKYNLKHDLRDHANPQRPGYGFGNEGGLLLCTWPRGGKPNLPFVYSDEIWTGIEYQVAAHLIAEGLVDEGLDVVRTVRDRYTGAVRNPFNEYECGSWYARALSSYALLQALTGARYDAVEQTLYIDSKVGDFRSFLSTAFGYATVGLENGEPFIDVKVGDIPIKKCVVAGRKATLKTL